MAQLPCMRKRQLAAYLLITYVLPYCPRIYILMLLQCSYHGWQFEGDGQCALIPQASDAAAANAAQSSRRLAHNLTEALLRA
jgi:Rieske [2Fe-2S] domain